MRRPAHGHTTEYADVAELADALDSGSSSLKRVWVQIPSSAPNPEGLRFRDFFFFQKSVGKVLDIWGKAGYNNTRRSAHGRTNRICGCGGTGRRARFRF